MVPSLGILRWVKTAENSIDYSLQNTVSQVLYLPTTRAQKYKAKQVIDTFVVRSGDLLAAGTVLVGTSVLAFGGRDSPWSMSSSSSSGLSSRSPWAASSFAECPPAVARRRSPEEAWR